MAIVTGKPHLLQGKLDSGEGGLFVIGTIHEGPLYTLYKLQYIVHRKYKPNSTNTPPVYHNDNMSSRPANIHQLEATGVRHRLCHRVLALPLPLWGEIKKFTIAITCEITETELCR